MKSILQQQYFYPTWLGIFVNPFFFARSGLVKAISGQSSQLSGKLLDIGCGSKPYQSLFCVDQYIGLDINSEHSRKRAAADYFYEGDIFPFETASFDSALCNQVLEHVFNPNSFLSEIHRVLKADGKLLLTVPFIWDEHEQPFDYARYSSFGLKALLEQNGFIITYHQKIGTDVSTLFQLINAYLYKVTEGWPRHPRFIFTISVMGLINLLGIIAKHMLPQNPDLFLDQLVIAEKNKKCAF